MMKSLKYLVLTMACILVLPSLQAVGKKDNPWKQVKKNYQTLITPKGPLSDEFVLAADEFLQKLQADGSWSDLNYQDTRRSAWEPSTHANRVMNLAVLYRNEQSKYYHSAEIAKAIHKALAWWFKNKPVCTNWWYNQIGTPGTFGRAFLILDDFMTPEELKGAIEVMDNAKLGMTGQNKIWQAQNVLMKALLQGDAELVKQVRDIIASEIVTGQPEGIKPDWSFHQHGPQQQFGNYGLSFLSTMSFFTRLFQGTPYAFSEEQNQILKNLVEQGYRWILWHGLMDMNSLGRQLVPAAQRSKGASAIQSSTGYGYAPEYLGLGNTLTGIKHFDDSDMTILRTNDWMFSVRMSSNRCIGTEYVNEDNRIGYYLGDGATYYYLTGEEYFDIFPYWDWHRIPGVTAPCVTTPIPESKAMKTNNKSDLVGGMEFEGKGFSAMQLNRDGLQAYKAWLATPEFILCLGAGIQAEEGYNVTTSVEQRLKNNAQLEQMDANGVWTPIADNAKHFNVGGDQQTYWHNNMGYIVAGTAFVHAGTEHRQGRWSDNMGTYSTDLVDGDVMYIYLDHGPVDKSRGSYQYVVLPNASKEETAKFNMRQKVEVLQNSADAQVVCLPSVGKGCWVAAYSTKPVVFRMPSTVARQGGARPQMQRFTPAAAGLYYIEHNGTEWTVKAEKPFRLTK
ncbi:MAG: polysaccharide lyase family 8 super-sandwich domain-containing protein [Bacteroidales bacterium]|nr:polysaccharide lyase family 8 super-sandwich domain-containing protein [Bacteroidales bacterium]